MDVVSDAISTVRLGRPSSNRLRVAGKWCVRLSPYEGAGFHVVLGGACWLLPDGGGEPVALGTGDVVLLPRGVGHVLADGPVEERDLGRAVPFEEVRDDAARPVGSGPEVELLCGKYRLERSRVHPLMAELPEVVHLRNRVGAHPELRSAVDLLARELTGSRPGAALALPSLLDLLLVYMVRAWTAEAETGAWRAVLADPVTTAALRALHAAPADSWTNDRLASEAGVSRATLARRFTSLVGRPPMAYLTWWRLTLAARRLRDTDVPLASVARETGYGSPYALSHAFSREFGTTPGRYRERVQEG
ncbi:AraC family transcriptional regulator [Streptomyces sp. NPDC058964]|uniref:AraC family transcriptional regulator n=1 Tax=Streptomyces sp. NPDC058964 TaxID=3346681 RepID=UPI0036927442